MARTAEQGKVYAKRWAKAYGSNEMLSREILGHGTAFPEHRTLQGVLRAMARAGILVEQRDFDERSKLYWLPDAVVENLMKEDDDAPV